MRVLILACLATLVSSEESFEENLKEGNQLLKMDPNADDTMELIQKLHGMKEELKSQSTQPNAEVLKAMEDYAKIKQSDLSVSAAQVNKHSKVGNALYQGDIMLTKEQADEIMEDIKEGVGNRNKRQAYRDDKYPNTLWPNLVNYYFYNATHGARRVFRKGAELWSADTCIDFKEDHTARDKVMVIHGAGCWSHVGRLGGTQILSLGKDCDFIGLGIHELGHTLGMFHTQSRHDRDEYITLHFENLLDGWENQFGKESERTNYNYNITYDYGTAMHYGATAVSRNRRPYMMPRDIKFLQTMGSYILSFYEKLMMNLHYKCLDKCNKGSSAKCENGGFPHPRDCSKCICPSGYGGRLCNERPPGCGKKLTATETYQELWDVVGQENYDRYAANDEFHYCNYWIEGPPGSTIEVIFQNYTENLSTDGCVWAGVEIKTLPDQRQTGYRFCSPDYGGTSLISSSNMVPVITYSRVYKVTSLLRYRLASLGSSTSQPETTPRPTSEPTQRCYERKLCEILVKFGFCNSTEYPAEVKKQACPRSCV